MEKPRNLLPQNANFLYIFAAFIIIIAGLRAASNIVVPFLLAIFISVIFATPYFWMRDRNVPSFLAMIVTSAIIFCVRIILAAIIDTSISDFTATLPLYKSRLQQEFIKNVAWLESFGIDLPDETLEQYFDPRNLLQLVGNMLRGLGSVLGDTVLIMVMVIFILLETTSLRAKLAAHVNPKPDTLMPYEEFLIKTKKYLGVKALISLATGFLVFMWLLILGVDYPLLWGLLAFLLNFIPTIGSILAAIPAVILAFIQYGIPSALLAATGYLVINFVIGSILEPKFLGQEVGLSTLVVFLSLVFWGWVFGPIGMLLSIPLTMTVKIGLDHNEKTRWLGTLLGSQVPDQEQ